MTGLRILKKKYPPTLRCIYCGIRSGPFADEHIIPYSLWGMQVFPKSSCKECEKITCRFEGVVSGQILGNIRHGLNAPSRRKRKTVARFRLKGVWKEMDPDEVPPALMLPRLAVSPSLSFKPSPAFWQQSDPISFWTSYHTGKMAAAMEKLSTRVPIIPDFQSEPFYQLLAKIGHSFASAELSSGSYPHLTSRPISWLLPDIILGKSKNFTSFIGGFRDEKSAPNDLFHLVEFGEVKILNAHPDDPWKTPWQETIVGISVYIRLFAWLGSPEYNVHVARFTDVEHDALSAG